MKYNIAVISEFGESREISLNNSSQIMEYLLALQNDKMNFQLGKAVVYIKDIETNIEKSIPYSEFAYTQYKPNMETLNGFLFNGKEVSVVDNYENGLPEIINGNLIVSGFIGENPTIKLLTNDNREFIIDGTQSLTFFNGGELLKYSVKDDVLLSMLSKMTSSKIDNKEVVEIKPDRQVSDITYSRNSNGDVYNIDINNIENVSVDFIEKIQDFPFLTHLFINIDDTPNGIDLLNKISDMDKKMEKVTISGPCIGASKEYLSALSNIKNIAFKVNEINYFARESSNEVNPQDFSVFLTFPEKTLAFSDYIKKNIDFLSDKNATFYKASEIREEVYTIENSLPPSIRVEFSSTKSNILPEIDLYTGKFDLTRMENDVFKGDFLGIGSFDNMFMKIYYAINNKSFDIFDKPIVITLRNPEENKKTESYEYKTIKIIVDIENKDKNLILNEIYNAMSPCLLDEEKDKIKEFCLFHTIELKEIEYKNINTESPEKYNDEIVEITFGPKNIEYKNTKDLKSILNMYENIIGYKPLKVDIENLSPTGLLTTPYEFSKRCIGLSTAVDLMQTKSFQNFSNGATDYSITIKNKTVSGINIKDSENMLSYVFNKLEEIIKEDIIEVDTIKIETNKGCFDVTCDKFGISASTSRGNKINFHKLLKDGDIKDSDIEKILNLVIKTKDVCHKNLISTVSFDKSIGDLKEAKGVIHFGLNLNEHSYIVLSGAFKDAFLLENNSIQKDLSNKYSFYKKLDNITDLANWFDKSMKGNMIQEYLQADKSQNYFYIKKDGDLIGKIFYRDLYSVDNTKELLKNIIDTGIEIKNAEMETNGDLTTLRLKDGTVYSQEGSIGNVSYKGVVIFNQHFNENNAKDLAFRLKDIIAVEKFSKESAIYDLSFFDEKKEYQHCYLEISKWDSTILSSSTIARYLIKSNNFPIINALKKADNVVSVNQVKADCKSLPVGFDEFGRVCFASRNVTENPMRKYSLKVLSEDIIKYFPNTNEKQLAITESINDIINAGNEKTNNIDKDKIQENN